MLKQFKVVKNTAIIVLSVILILNVVPGRGGLLQKWISHLRVTSHSSVYFEVEKLYGQYRGLLS